MVRDACDHAVVDRFRGVHIRRHAFALVEQWLEVRAAMKGLHAHHDVVHCSSVVAMQSLVRAAVKIKLAVTDRFRGVHIRRHAYALDEQCLYVQSVAKTWHKQNTRT